MNDLRWKQRFSNYVRSLRHLRKMVKRQQEHPLSEDDRTLMVKYFEMSQQLAIKVLKDYLREKELGDLSFPKDIIKEAFRQNLIANGDDLDCSVRGSGIKPPISIMNNWHKNSLKIL